MWLKFILMDDNEKPHRVLLVDEFLESEDIRRINWLARSQDLNPIKHVWDAMRRTIQEMKAALKNEWDELPQELINCLFKYDVTLRGLYSRKREPYPLLTHFFCLFYNRCFIPSISNESYERSCLCIAIVE
ncbi:transposable element Tc1 transposase [Trichonephila clavipes]|nr:transposable element Tc1 transposase [Trichonephila clavipes]